MAVLAISVILQYYTGAPIVGIAPWSVPRIGQGHLEVTRREKSNSFPTPHNILLYIFWNLRYLIEVLKCFLDGI